MLSTIRPWVNIGFERKNCSSDLPNVANEMKKSLIFSRAFQTMLKFMTNGRSNHSYDIAIN